MVHLNEVRVGIVPHSLVHTGVSAPLGYLYTQEYAVVAGICMSYDVFLIFDSA